MKQMVQQVMSDSGFEYKLTRSNPIRNIVNGHKYPLVISESHRSLVNWKSGLTRFVRNIKEGNNQKRK